MNLLYILRNSLFMSDEEIRSFAASSPYRYKVYSIAKRNSQERRIIAHPSRELKFVQRIIVNLLEEQLPIHFTAKAYKKNLSIKDNAQPHVKAKYLLKMDLKKFFPSIQPSLFFRECYIHGVELSDIDKELLEGFLFWKRRRATSLVLSIGAPSSPIISNFILYRFDRIITEHCRKLGINYSRYADDLTFSTNEKDILLNFPSKVRKTLSRLYSGQIKVNLKKTVLSSKAHNRHVTGITLSNDGTLSVGREKKRKLSASIHHFLQNKLSADEIMKLKGDLAHAAFIEPTFLDRMTKKYGSDIISRIKHHSNKKE